MTESSIIGIAVLLTSFVITAGTGHILLPALHQLHFGQSIREYGPKEHLKKSGTPTMGGLMMFSGVIFASFIWVPDNMRTMMALLLFGGYGIIGFIDDGLKIGHKRNLGLTALQKILLQLLLASLYLILPGEAALSRTELWIPVLGEGLYLGAGYFVFFLILLVGTTNAVNLTDGLDGLAASVTVPVMLAYTYIAYDSQHLQEAWFSLAIVGACLAFLIYNRHPARCFMGDTGSLALGGAVAAAAIGTGQELLLVVIGGVYVLEALSVILQVGYFKLTHGKRIFRMAPLHHHFELGGMEETTVVKWFFLMSCIFSLCGVALYMYSK